MLCSNIDNGPTQNASAHLIEVSMNQIIVLNGREIPYTLMRKNVKNVNLRIRADGSVSVSANIHVPIHVIEGFLQEKANAILAALEQYAKRPKQSPGLRQYITGERFRFLGEDLSLLVSPGESAVILEGAHILLRLPNPGDAVRKDKLITQWYNRQCQEIFTEIVEEAYPAFQPYGVKMPQLVLRTMKSRWGSCNPTRGIITLNKRLIEYPRPAIEYVVVHEFVHFLHPNHAKPYYATLTAHMLDWKARKKLLS